MSNNFNLRVLLGTCDEVLNSHPIAPYDALVCSFLRKLSAGLMNDPDAKKYSDIISFAYWCRTSNITRLKSLFVDDQVRIGRGTVFHITPSNVPINFAFSYVFGILSGNANIVRIPSKHYLQIDIILDAIKHVLLLPEFSALKKMTCFIEYPKSDEITRHLSSKCDARVIWGGDDAINNIRAIPIPNRAVEVAFPDRYSLCIINASSVIQTDTKKLTSLAENFFNDAFIFDQGACSSPRWVVWQGDSAMVERAKVVFWSSVYEFVKKNYKLEPINAINKYSDLCEAAIKTQAPFHLDRHDNFISRLCFSSPPNDIEISQLKFGTFCECSINSLGEMRGLINARCQTLTYFGVHLSDIKKFIFEYGLKGVDRVVPVGVALEIGPIWDGFDLIRTLSRVIEIR